MRKKTLGGILAWTNLLLVIPVVILAFIPGMLVYQWSLVGVQIIVFIWARKIWHDDRRVNLFLEELKKGRK